jgi:DNA-directed RNA polymerase specialized sigma24 family protein
MWCLLLLEHLEEFATLAWYLVADGNLVEDTFLRTMAKLDAIPFDDSVPHVAYNQVRSTIISQAVVALAEIRKREESNNISQILSSSDLPDLSRLAFILRLVIRRSELEVANLLDITPSEVKELVTDAIKYMGASNSYSESGGFAEA